MLAVADECADADERADADVPLCRCRSRLARFSMLILNERRGIMELHGFTHICGVGGATVVFVIFDACSRTPRFVSSVACTPLRACIGSAVHVNTW